MFDSWEYQIAANTSEANRVTHPCKISPGIIRDVRVFFPLGCNGLARCRVFKGQAPIAPQSSGSYITGDGLDVGATDIYEPTEGNMPELTWEIWNVDDTYAHTLTLKAAWVTEEELMVERGLLAAILNRIDALVRALGGG